MKITFIFINAIKSIRICLLLIDMGIEEVFSLVQLEYEFFIKTDGVTQMTLMCDFHLWIRIRKLNGTLNCHTFTLILRRLFLGSTFLVINLLLSVYLQCPSGLVFLSRRAVSLGSVCDLLTPGSSSDMFYRFSLRSQLPRPLLWRYWWCGSGH